MTRTSTPQLAARFLGTAEVPEALRQASSAPRYRAALDELLPLDLLTATHFMRLEGETVWLRADSPAVATRVRQIQARLRRGLVERGLVASAVKVKAASPHFRRREPSAKPARVLPAEALQSLERAAGRLPDGPLRQAMLRMAKRGVVIGV